MFYVLQTSWLLFRLLFPAISYYSQHLAPPLHNVYMVSGHSHTLDMAIHEHSIRDSTCSVRIVTSIVAALYPVDVPHGVCVL